MNIFLLAPIFISFLAGLALLVWSFREKRTPSSHKTEAKPWPARTLFLSALSLSALCTVFCSLKVTGSVVLFHLFSKLPIALSLDSLGRFFVLTVTLIWVVVGFYSITYLTREGEEKRFFGFFLLLYGVLYCLGCSQNLVTMYLFYELMSLTSFPLVLHNGSREAIMASLKYLFYSMCGAYMGLFGIFVLYHTLPDLSFVAGGSASQALLSQGDGLLPVAILIMLLGFSVKAGMFPLHAWLPTAHPVAPSPASAALSGIIVKCGVLAIIRVMYYIIGPSALQGSFLLTVLQSLSLITVFMGSLLAFREKVFKKRLAYSTVSQVSYILFGLFIVTPQGVQGALLHLLFHAIVKCGLFLTAGVFLYSFGYTRVDQLQGVGKKMPVTLWCYTFFALALVGIPPTCGFLSKWYLAQGAFASTAGVFRFLGPVILLVSALLTAGYLLPITMDGFFVTKETTVHADKPCEPSLWMLIPLLILALLTLGLGLFPNAILSFTQSLSDSLFQTVSTLFIIR